ncbi:hypothetical protein W02_33880 [Nitrospira sp. KM1]|uniref:methyl-accepting chemotaxis protein n=1 Tax=Nitrospira sp. KM1 TaxID=1936990 RepID=UPI0013A72103|nr:methyl-accepting chemotaxis protein [Nitrospira sp. KM1]BCA56248.1 hypothetical protein W02_33880 [Nitrospira sp. KM1]
MTTLAIGKAGSAELKDQRRLHRIQKGYALWIGLLLFLYSSLFFTLAFFGPHLQPLMTLYTTRSLIERQEAAVELLTLSETVWVAVPVLFFGAVVFSLILTRRVAGPLRNLELSVGEWAQGNLTARLQFRKTDRLDHLATSINGAIETIEGAFITVSGEHTRALTALDRARAAIQLSPALSQDLLKNLTDASEALTRAEASVERFRFRKSN